MMDEEQLIIFKSGDLTLSVPFTPDQETVWLSQGQMVELFERDVSVISRHIRNVFSEGELDRKSNLHFLQIATSDRPVAYYSLDVIISVGYRVKSQRGVEFRKWATRVLKDYMIQGYADNAHRLSQLGQAIQLMRRAQQSLDSAQVLTAIERYSQALTLLDDYDHQTLRRPDGSRATYV